jgi:hypothetical protein
MPFGDITLRPDWQNIEQLEKAAAASRRNTLQLALTGYGLIALAIAPLRGSSPWLGLFQTLLFAGAFVWLPLWTATAAKPGRHTTLIVSALVLFPSAALSFFTAPAAVQPPTMPPARLPVWLCLLVPVASAVLISWVSHRHRGLSFAVGLQTRAWGYQAVIGLSLGIALCFHLLVTAGAVGRAPSLTRISLQSVVWLLATTSGLTALGAELALSGTLFRLLVTEMGTFRLGIFFRIVALSTPLYLAPVILDVRGASLPVTLLYGSALASLAVVLRFGFRSIVAPLAANVVFSLFVALGTIT